MNETEAQLFARLKEEDAEFRRLADKHREFDRKIMEFDRIYYLTSDQERKRKELQKMKLRIKDEMYVIMRRHMQARDATIVPSGSSGPSQDGGYQRKS